MNDLKLPGVFGKPILVPETNLSQNNQPSFFKARALPLLFLPSSLSGIVFEQSRLAIPLPEEKPTSKKIPTPKEKKKDIVYLPEVDTILTAYANAYVAIEFTVRFVKYVQNPANRSKGKILVSDKSHLQETLLFYKGNAGNLSNLEYSLESETAQCVEKLKKVQYLYKDKNFKLLEEEAKKFIVVVKDSLNKTRLAQFFGQRKADIFENTGFNEIAIVAETLVEDSRVRAMLEVLVYAEGTGGDYGRIAFGVVKQAKYFPELVGQRDVTITDFSRHPEIYVEWRAGQPLSSAAGRYQFNVATWTDFGRGDFSSRSQDIAAVRLMIHLGMVDELLNGNVRQAIYNGSARWASFPTSEAGASNFPPQRAKPVAELERIYNQNLPR
jgi:hypothetical protein